MTVLFTDVVGSTALAERVDPESLRRAMGRYFSEMRAVLERHGGTVEKFIGDAVMAVFGIPAVHEDDALRAVQAAVEMREALARLNDDLERESGLRIEIRTGVNTGDVVAGDPGEGQSFVSGDAVNVAARLEQHAGPGEILIGETTWHLVRHATSLELVEPIAAKGKRDPVPAWRVASVEPGAQVGDRGLRSPLVGRDGEMDALRAAFGAMMDEGGAHLVTVLGPAGAGKSRLTREFTAEIAARATVLQGRCLHYGEGITFWPVAEIVRQAAGIVGDEPEDDARARLAALLPRDDESGVVSERVAAVVGVAESTGPIEETFWAIRRLLEALAEPAPLVAVVEDVHWAEPTLLDLLEYLADFVGDRRILLLCTARPDLLELRPSWAAPRERAASVTLRPLDERASEELVTNLLNAALLPQELRERIVRTAEGNPLFVEEFLRMLIDEGRLERVNAHWSLVGDSLDLAVPPTIRALLSARLDRLEAAERAVIQRASVVGKIFYWGAVSRLSPEADRPAVGRHLQTLVRKELIRPDRGEFGGEDAFRFGHILIRDAAYDATPKRTRAALHERFAEWLEGRSVGRAGGLEEFLGYHLEQARRYLDDLGPPDDHAREVGLRAAEHLGRAGKAALGRGDARAAENLLSRAMDLLPADDTDRLDLALNLIDAVWTLGDQAGMEALIENTAATVPPETALAHRLGVREVLRRIMTEPSSDFRGLHDEARAHAVALEQLGDELGQSEAWFMAGRLGFDTGRLAEAAEELERALVRAEAAGHRQRMAQAIMPLSWILTEDLTPVDRAIAALELLRERADGHRLAEGAVDLSIAHHLALAGRSEEAGRRAEAARRGFEDLGARLMSITFVSLFSSRIDVILGNTEVAAARERRSFHVLERMGNSGFLSSRAAFLALVLPDLGLDDEAMEFATIAEQSAARDDLEPQVWLRQARAKVMSHRGDHEGAERQAGEALAIISATEWAFRQAEALATLSAVLEASGRTDEAVAHLRHAIELYDRKQATYPAGQARRHLEALIG